MGDDTDVFSGILPFFDDFDRHRTKISHLDHIKIGASRGEHEFF